MKRPSLILGSSSPRRRDLLDAVGLSYVVCKPDTEEIPRPGEAPRAYTLRLAHEKGHWVAGRFLDGHLDASLPDPRGDSIIISADTIVVLENEILEKPRDRAHAVDMLTRLGGRAHTVISGVSLTHATRTTRALVEERFAVETAVWIKPLTPREIDAYVASGEPLDKAGGYAAQGIGSYMVQRIEGSYANVVGLPVAEVVDALARRFAYSLWSEGTP